MTSTTSDHGQQMLRQSLTPPGSQAVAVSLCDKQAIWWASGESKDTAIWIPSDDDSDTEDEDEEGQGFDDTQSYPTPTTISPTDHLDSTGTKCTPTKSEAAIGMDSTPAVSLARVEDDSILTHDSHMAPFADPEPNQQSPCQTHRSYAGDANFGASPTSSESQPCLGMSDEQEPVTRTTGANSEPGIMMIDALSGEGSCHGAQSTPASPSMHIYSPVAAIPGGMAQTLLHGSEVCARTSPDDAIPGAGTSSPAVRLSPESLQEQDFDHTSCGSSIAESESSEAESGSPFGARVSSPSQELPSPRRPRRRSSHAHETVQDKGSDVYTEGSGSEDGFDVPECVRDEDYCLSPKVQGHGSGDDSDDEEQHCRKRRKVSRPPHSSAHSAPTCARSSRRERRSTRAAAHSMRKRDTSAYGVLSPTPSQASSVSSEASAFLARFQEWPLKNVSMKRITENGKTTFQFQFEWPLCASHSPINGSVSKPGKGRRSPKASSRAAKSSGDKWTPAEEDTVCKMKRDGCSWAEIHRALPHRSQGTIQVRYSTKLRS